MNDDQTIADRLEQLRAAIRAENISYGELADLQGLAEHIDPGDVELLEWAGVPEHDDDAISTDHESGVREVFDADTYTREHPDAAVATCGHCRRSWDDNHVSGITPAPSGRCPFEYEHDYDDDDDDDNDVSHYDWRVQVRVTGKRNGWSSTLADTPTFELRSNAQYGGVWNDAQTVAHVARDMFAGLADDGDDIHVTVSALDGSDPFYQVFTA